MNKKIILIIIASVGIMGGVWYMVTRVKPISEQLSPESKATSTPILTLQWKLTPVNQTQEEIDSLGQLYGVILKLSGVKNEEIELVKNSVCSVDKTKGIVVETSPAFEEMAKNNLLMLSCEFGGAGDQFSVNQESPTELVIRHAAEDGINNFSENSTSEIIKRIEIPQGAMVKVEELIDERKQDGVSLVPTNEKTLTLQWKLTPAKQTQEEIDMYGILGRAVLAVSGIKNEEIELVNDSFCFKDPEGSIITKESQAYKEMTKNNLLMLSCWFAGAGDQFSVNRESPTELVVKHVSVDEGDDFPVSEYKATVIKKIEIPEGTVIRVGPLLDELTPLQNKENQ